MVQIPITAMIINKAAVLSGLTSENKPRQYYFIGQIEQSTYQPR